MRFPSHKPYPSMLAVYPRNQGFTLIEVMVVLVMLSIFAGMIAVSVGTGNARKNRAFYEHLTGSMDYIRLLSAERMQPMGIRNTTDEDGQLVLQVVRLDNAYGHYQNNALQSQDSTKNAMELSANIRDTDDSAEQKTARWVIDNSMEMPALPADVTITVNSLEQEADSREIQPWFVGQDVPDVMWFGTGQATAVTIEIKHNDRLVGDVIQVLPDGSMQTDNDTKDNEPVN